MSERSLSALLAENCIHHEPSDVEGKRDLYTFSREYIGTFDAQEAFEYLRKNHAINH